MLVNQLDDLIKVLKKIEKVNEIAKPVSVEKEHVDDDVEYVRNNIRNLIKGWHLKNNNEEIDM